MAHKKAGGSTALGRDSAGQRLGVKVYGGQAIHPGMIIVRQRGTKFHPGDNVRRGSDDTLFATAKGVVYFSKKIVPNFYGKLRLKKFVHVKPETKKQTKHKTKSKKTKKL